MARKVDVEHLVGAEEIAERLNVKPQAVYNWRQRHPDFPAPIKVLHRTMIWSWPDVKAWARKTGRLK